MKGNAGKGDRYRPVDRKKVEATYERMKRNEKRGKQK